MPRLGRGCRYGRRPGSSSRHCSPCVRGRACVVRSRCRHRRAEDRRRGGGSGGGGSCFIILLLLLLLLMLLLLLVLLLLVLLLVLLRLRGAHASEAAAVVLGQCELGVLDGAVHSRGAHFAPVVGRPAALLLQVEHAPVRRRPRHAQLRCVLHEWIDGRVD